MEFIDFLLDKMSSLIGVLVGVSLVSIPANTTRKSNFLSGIRESLHLLLGMTAGFFIVTTTEYFFGLQIINIALGVIVLIAVAYNWKRIYREFSDQRVFYTIAFFFVFTPLILALAFFYKIEITSFFNNNF